MKWPDPPEGFEVMREFVDVEITARIVGTRATIQFNVVSEVVPGTRAHDSAEVVAAVAAAMLLVWQDAWHRRPSPSLSVEYRALNSVYVLTADTESVPLDAVADGARDLIREP